MAHILDESPTGYAIFYRSYSRNIDGHRESWEEAIERQLQGLIELGSLTDAEVEMLRRHALAITSIPSGRWMWVGGTEWSKRPENFYGSYNCSSTNLNSWEAFGHMLNLEMQGCGTGAVLEAQHIDKLPPITTRLNLVVQGSPGDVPGNQRLENTVVVFPEEGQGQSVQVIVGDSRQGWVDAYVWMLQLASGGHGDALDVVVDISHARPMGERLKGFGGVANPVKLPDMFCGVASVLNKAVGRQMNSVECCLVIDHGAACVVAGNIRRCIAKGEEVAVFDAGWGLQWVPIEDVVVGMEVYNTGGTRKVINKFNQGIQPVTRITVSTRGSDDILLCTEKHKVAKSLGGGNGYVMTPASELNVGDTLITLDLGDIGNDGSTDFGTIFSIERNVDAVETYDLEVEEIHEYFCEGILVSNSAGMRQFDSDDALAATAKDNLWQQGEDGTWRIDPERDPLRMANHTRAFHHRPTLEEVTEAVTKQFWSGEGAIQYVPEAIARANRDLLSTDKLRQQFIDAYVAGHGRAFLLDLAPERMPEDELEYRLSIYGLNPCGEILLSDNFCNLAEVHLNRFDALDPEHIDEAFRAAAVNVSVLLHHKFPDERYQRSRELDPIVGVSFTGLFDFFVKAFGVDWLRWWEAGRDQNWDSWGNNDIALEILEKVDSDYAKSLFLPPSGSIYHAVEEAYLSRWNRVVHKQVAEYCQRNGLKIPNRCTTAQPAGSKSLLTGASPGWHPPKAQRYIRRMTFAKNDPIALAAIDYGYSVVPSQSDKDESGKLLDDPFDARCTEWLVEIPVEVPWANLPGCSDVAIENFKATTQFDFYMQVQKHYTTHNTSATIEYRQDEILELSQAIYDAIQKDQGYISVALLARFDDIQTYPRLPFEPIDKATYDRLMEDVLRRRSTDDFHGALSRYDQGEMFEAGPAGCDSDKCLLPLKQPG